MKIGMRQHQRETLRSSYYVHPVSLYSSARTGVIISRKNVEMQKFLFTMYIYTSGLREAEGRNKSFDIDKGILFVFLFVFYFGASALYKRKNKTGLLFFLFYFFFAGDGQMGERGEIGIVVKLEERSLTCRMKLLELSEQLPSECLCFLLLLLTLSVLRCVCNRRVQQHPHPSPARKKEKQKRNKRKRDKQTH